MHESKKQHPANNQTQQEIRLHEARVQNNDKGPGTFGHVQTDKVERVRLVPAKVVMTGRGATL